ncbi:MAG: hypothetical protein R3248_01690 [Candidatus Promineifilaceae bacterium]|nr:hypothetical protein [Candidatus Promineifilaceae bacterium]
MLRKWSAIAIVLLLAIFVVAGAVHAANTKYEFDDVTIDEETTVEIEAAVKDNKKSDYSVCSYYSDDYAEYLGQYAEETLAGDTAERVLDFCVENFGNRTE